LSAIATKRCAWNGDDLQYDSHGQKKHEVFHDGGSTVDTEYDPNGNVVSVDVTDDHGNTQRVVPKPTKHK